MIDKSSPIPTIKAYSIYAEPGNTWQFWIGVGAGGIVWNFAQGPAVNLDEWTHLAAVYSNGEQKLYVNGVLDGESSAELNINTEQELLIGAGANERKTHEYLFAGKIDDVRVYNRTLTEPEIARVMESEGAAVEFSGKLATKWGVLKTQ